MRLDDVGWRAYVAVNIDAEPRLQALARARGWTPARSVVPPGRCADHFPTMLGVGLAVPP